MWIYGRFRLDMFDHWRTYDMYVCMVVHVLYITAPGRALGYQYKKMFPLPPTSHSISFRKTPFHILSY